MKLGTLPTMGKSFGCGGRCTLAAVIVVPFLSL